MDYKEYVYHLKRNIDYQNERIEYLFKKLDHLKSKGYKENNFDFQLAQIATTTKQLQELKEKLFFARPNDADDIEERIEAYHGFIRYVRHLENPSDYLFIGAPIYLSRAIIASNFKNIGLNIDDFDIARELDKADLCKNVNLPAGCMFVFNKVASNYVFSDIVTTHENLKRVSAWLGNYGHNNVEVKTYSDYLSMHIQKKHIIK